MYLFLFSFLTDLANLAGDLTNIYKLKSLQILSKYIIHCIL